ncbi:hypothetical protein M9H77_13642 [Catharanthus roseus]|uniref:Uncharacterized protein n=1 Tax=Catharanthus roseus TaxID=4058 RepID=A0ACC0BKX3_CATRO|nr:hypothetical protein M9H77_13642 [Catharanthus roseus]
MQDIRIGTKNVNSNITDDEIQKKIIRGFEDWFRIDKVSFLPYPSSKRPRTDWISVMKSQTRVIDVIVQDDAFQENMDVHEALTIDVMIEDVDLLSMILVHRERYLGSDDMWTEEKVRCG